MNNKRRVIRIIEKYFNEIKKDEVELFYGTGTKIKIKQIDYITQGKYLMVDAVIILGETINEEVMDRVMVDYYIQDIISLMFPDYSTKVLLGWDV